MRFVSILCLLAASCSSTRGDDGPASSDAIQGGEIAHHSPAVGILLSATSMCSGTLVAPRWVLTAAHCASASTDFYTGDGAAATNQPLAVTLQAMTRHPVKHEAVAHPAYVKDTYACPNPGPDLALVELEAPITDITPVRLGRPREDAIWCQVVGLGTHDVESLGQKRWDSEEVTVLTTDVVVTRRVPGSFYYGMSDHGDSGGPVFCNVSKVHGVEPPPPTGEPTGALVGVTSCGASASEGVYALVAPVRSWIAELTHGEAQ